jgi:CHAD domain-containing protein
MESLDSVDKLATDFTNANLDDKEDTTSYPKPKSRATRTGRKRIDSATSTHTENHGNDLEEAVSALSALGLQSQQEADEAVIDASSAYPAPYDDAQESSLENTLSIVTATTATASPLAASTGDERTPNSSSLPPSTDKPHQRVNSQQKDISSVLRLKSRLSRTQEELGDVKHRLEEASTQIKELRAQIESYDTAELSKRQKRVDRGNELKSELKQCQDRIKDLEERDGMREMLLDGRASTVFDIIHFKKVDYNDLSTDVVMSRTFTFSKKQWWKDNQPMEGRDKAAVGCIRFGGRFYIAKSGQTREDFGDFINSDHWTDEAVQLAQVLGLSVERG